MLMLQWKWMKDILQETVDKTKGSELENSLTMKSYLI